MSIKFKKIPFGTSTPRLGKDVVYLKQNSWDDYDYKTQFYATYFDFNGTPYELGDLKIGYVGQESPSVTAESIPNEEFSSLGKGYFSLGQDVDYYRNIFTDNIPELLRREILSGLNDVVNDNDLFENIKDEQVFGTSLTRGIPTFVIINQYRRIVNNGVALTEYKFAYDRPSDDKYSGIYLDFDVIPDENPSTNIHVIIGRNGIGKTTILNDMVCSLVKRDVEHYGSFIDKESGKELVPEDYLSGVVSVSFSSFDPFVPPKEKTPSAGQLGYSYVGLKKVEYDKSGAAIESRHKDMNSFADDFMVSIKVCFRLSAKKSRWIKAIESLESDYNFADMGLTKLAEIDDLGELYLRSTQLFRRLSSGHAIVLLTITSLVEKVEEKTLVFLDEPESHLHPPLLSAFIRALSGLLINRNGIAIIATHSPVILQEVPKSCVWKLTRSYLDMKKYRPEDETFGENVGVLTREVFGLEVSKSGFHAELSKSVGKGGSFESILNEFKGQIGFEGKAILQSLIASRDFEVDF